MNDFTGPAEGSLFREPVMVTWNDIEYAVRLGGARDDVDSSAHWLNFTLWQILPGTYGAYPPDAPYLAEGFLKWDGCMQWTYHDSMHIDDPGDIDRFAEAVKRIRDWFAERSPLADFPARGKLAETTSIHETTETTTP